MTRRLLFPPILLASLLTGCVLPQLDEEAGRETGPCVQSQCFGGLSCLSDFCVDASDSGGANETSGAGSAGAATPGSSDTTSGGEDHPADGSESTTTASVTASASSDASDEFNDEFGEEGPGFLTNPDGLPGGEIECDIWDQDCPLGEKCTAWASDGVSWNATRCVDVVNSPDDVGENCQIELNAASGLDTCVEGALCWDVDFETDVGECVAYCSGQPENAWCPSGQTCAIANGGVLALCLPTCDPMVQDCEPGLGCYPISDSFACAPVVSDAGSFGEACFSINACTPGLACLEAEVAGVCGAAASCCTSFCDVAAAELCPVPGQICTAWYAQGEEPPGLENIGLCMVP